MTRATPIARHGTRGRECGTAGDVSHGKPPFGERPRGTLGSGRGALDGGLEVVRGAGVRELIEEPGEEAVGSGGSIHGHATGPPSAAAPADVTSSIDIEERIAPSDRWRRDFAVPTGMPSMAATRGSGRSR